MDGRRRKIEVDEAVADALEKRAAEGSMSVSDLLAADYLMSPEVVLSAEHMAELEARGAEWERDRLGYDADDVIDWLKKGVTGENAPFPTLRKY